MWVTPTLSWTLGADPGEALDPRLAPLLQAIESTGSLSAAVAQRRISYRAAWGLLRDQQRKLGAPLVVFERGRGTRLASAGVRLLSGQRAAEKRLAGMLPRLAIELTSRDARGLPASARLVIAASHDLALAALRDALRGASPLAVDLAFMGSLHALEQFAAGRVDMAGFHVAPGLRNGGDLAPFRRLLHARRDRLLRFVDRDQGLILARGNPARVRSFEDLARKRLRFVNRQRGSGTRVLIDRLLADEGVDAGAIAGYANEEFTHAAVAATVASGAADAAFGVRAAAAEYRLAFEPRVRERYYLALRAKALLTPGVALLIESLQGPLLQRIVRRLPGYRCEAAGTILAVAALGE